MLSIIKKLCVTPRFVGSAGSILARKLIISELERLGYKYSLSSTYVPNWNINGFPELQFLKPEKLEVRGIPAIFSPPTPPEGVEGKVIPAGYITMLDSFNWERYAVIDESGEVVAYLISTTYGAQVQPLPFEEQDLPYVILDSKLLEKLHNWSKSGEIWVKVKNPTKLSGSVEVISIVTEEPTVESYPLICAHYDTVFDSPGAHDNASGVAVALKLAEELKNIPCRFAFFDGEEVNKAGSQAFVENEKAKGDLNKISFVLEIDAVGIGNEVGLLCSKRLFKKLQKCFKGTPEGYKVSISRQSKIGFSDVWPFMKEGILVIRMLTRGGISRDIMHTEKDTLDKISVETLTDAFNVARRILEVLQWDIGESK